MSPTLFSPNILVFRNLTFRFSQEQLRETSAEARRGIDDQAPAKKEQAQQITQKDESEADTVPAADLERALAATDEAVRESRDLFAKNSALTSRLEFADKQVRA